MAQSKYRIVQPREYNYYHVEKRYFGLLWLKLGYTKTKPTTVYSDMFEIYQLPVLCSQAEINEVIDWTGNLLSVPYKFADIALAEYFIKLMTDDEKIERVHGTEKVIGKYDIKGNKLDV